MAPNLLSGGHNSLIGRCGVTRGMVGGTGNMAGHREHGRAQGIQQCTAEHREQTGHREHGRAHGKVYMILLVFNIIYL